MTQTDYDLVREACVQANPEIKQMDCGSPCHCKILKYRDIRLADVLLAIHARKCRTCDGNGGIMHPDTLGYKSCPDCDGDVYYLDGHSRCDIIDNWDLRHDSLEWHRDNKPETVAWLAKLLTSN